MELGTQKISKFGKKFWLKAAGILVGVSIIFSWGSSSAKVDLGKEKVSYDELVKVIGEKEKEVKVVEKKLSDVEKEYDSKKTELEKAMEVVNNKQKVEDEITKLDGSIKSKQDEIAKLDADISKKQGELAAVTGQIKEKGEAPIVLPAGTFTTGKDIPAGRYKAEPNRGSGNFFVNGGMDVNIILGGGDFGEPEYIFSVQDGDEIEITLSVKFTAVQ
jgi:septal ring factor EnvC (AmiA/AmiB activator)